MRSDFDAVGEFHEKFGLPNATTNASNPREIDPALRDFRLKFLLEELTELCEGYGLGLKWEIVDHGGRQDLPKIADALVDLSYVTLGTAHVHQLPWAALFAEVQRANVTKERCKLDHKFMPQGDGLDLCVMAASSGMTTCERPRAEHSLRGSANDVIKPPGWSAPRIVEALMAAGWPGPALPLEEA